MTFGGDGDCMTHSSGAVSWVVCSASGCSLLVRRALGKGRPCTRVKEGICGSTGENAGAGILLPSEAAIRRLLSRSIVRGDEYDIRFWAVPLRRYGASRVADAAGRLYFLARYE